MVFSQNPRVQNQWTKPHSRSANIWHRRQQQQELLTELQPADETEEQRQLNIAIEMSRRQADIDAHQRCAYVLFFVELIQSIIKLLQSMWPTVIFISCELVDFASLYVNFCPLVTTLAKQSLKAKMY